MSILIKPGDAWQEPEHIQSRNPDGVLQDVEVVRAKIGSEYVDVWPEYQQAIHYLMLYDYGDMCRDVTGGYYESVIQPAWGNGVGTATIGSTYLQCYGTGNGSIAFTTNRPVDFTEYAKLCGVYERSEANSNVWQYIVYTGKDKLPLSSSSTGRTWLGNTVGGSISKRFAVYADISAMSGKHYVGVGTNFTYTEKYYMLCIVKADNWQTWLSKAGLSAASLADVMRDSTALTTLLSSHVATQYMLLQCTGDVMVSAIQSAAFKAALAASPYKDKIYANSHWAKFLAMV